MIRTTRVKGIHKIGLAVILLLPLQIIYPCVWFSLPVQGRIVDERTQVGIPEAIVVANWELRGGWVDSHDLRSLHSVAVLTNAAGEYRVPFWGPRFHFSIGHLDSASFRIRAFKPGFSPNGSIGRGNGTAQGKRFFDTKYPDIALLQADANSSLYASALDSLGTIISLEFGPTPCQIRDMRPLLDAIGREWSRLRPLGFHSSFELNADVANRDCENG